MKRSLLAIAIAGLFPMYAFAASAPSVPQASIRIPGGAHGIGFDDIGFAAALDRVTVPAGTTGNLVLVNPTTDALTVIPGVSAAPATRTRREGTTSAMYADGYLFASDHDPAEVVTIDPRTRMVVARTPLESGPDYVRYVARTHEVWVTEPGKQQIQVFRLNATPTPKLTAETVIPIAGGPESLEIDNRANRAYSNLWKSKTVEMELTTHKVLAEWPNTCKDSHGVALDPAHHRLFVGCGGGKVVALATNDHGKLLATAHAGAGIDIISYSPHLHHLYVPGARAQTLTVFNVTPAGAMDPIATYKTGPHAHCVTDDNHGHVFVCDPATGSILKIDDH